MNRAPTPAELAMLMLARAIDHLGDEIAAMHKTVQRVESQYNAIEERDAWVNAYRAEDTNPFAELGEVTHAQARHYIEPDEWRQ